jgi:hypothetical protein
VTTWRAFAMTVLCLLGAIFIGPQPNILGLPVFHAIGFILALMALRFFVKFTRNWKRDLTGRRGSQAMYAQRMAQPPTIQKTSPGSNVLTFKGRSDEIMDA